MRIGLLPPATKLGQGYVFTRVCDSVNGGCVLSQHAWQVVFQHALQQVSEGGGLLLAGCLVLGWGAWPQGGGCSGGDLLRGVPGPGVCSGGRCLVETPLGQPLLRAVRILLECILVSFCLIYLCHFRVTF